MHKLNLRMPESLIEEARIEAAALHVSLNTYILQAVANYTPYTRSFRERRDKRGSDGAGAGPAITRPQAPGAPSTHGATATGGAGRVVPKVGKQQPCPCGSGQRYGRCHGRP